MSYWFIYFLGGITGLTIGVILSHVRLHNAHKVLQQAQWKYDEAVDVMIAASKLKHNSEFLREHFETLTLSEGNT